MSRYFRLGALAVVVLLALSALFGSYYTVEQGDRSVLLRFGKAISIEDPGLHFKFPFADNAVPMSVREQKERVKMETYSKDQQAADLVVSVNYRLLPSEVLDVYSRLGKDYFDTIVMTQLPKKTKEVFGRYTAQSIVEQRTQLGVEVEGALRGAVDARGIQIISVQVEDVSFSSAYEKSVEQRMQAEVASVKAAADKQRRMTDADAGAYEVKAQADAQAHATKVKGEAEAYAIERRAEALRKNKDLVALTAVEKWDGKLPASMVPGGAVPFVNLNSSTVNGAMVK